METLHAPEALLEAIADGLAVVDGEGSVTYANAAGLLLLGLPDTGHAPFLSLVHPEDLPVVREALDDLKERPSTDRTLAFRLAHGDAAPRWVEAVARNLLSESAIAGYLFCLRGECHRRATRDLAARKRAEEELGRSEALNRRIIESCRDCLQILDIDGRLLSTSRAGRLLLEVQDGESMEGISWLDLWRGSDRKKAEAALQAALETGTGKFQGICPTFRGKPRWWDVLVTPILDAAGEPDRLLAVSRDITEQKTVEDALRRSEEQLRQSHKMEAVGRLAGGVAHDFNNLLTAIAGYSDLLLRSMPGEDTLRSHVLEIRKAGERAAALTRQLLTFSRKRTAVARVFDLGHAVADMRQMLARLIGEDIELTTSCAPALAKVSADPAQVEQVILNLAVNARDAMPRGGRLSIEAADDLLDGSRPGLYFPAAPGAYVRLTVADTGVGMSEEVKAHLFEPFFTTKPAGHGTGLGLSMVYGIVQQAGGNLAVESEAGKGTRISIWLPAEGGGSEEEDPPSPEPVPLRRRRGETILLVEDEGMVRRLVAEVLGAQGYRVVEADSGSRALSLAGALEGPLDLLLTDVVMAGMSGRELAEKLLSMRPGLKVLYMSGYTEDAVLRHGVYQNSMAFLGKPFSPLALVQKLRELLDGKAGREPEKVMQAAVG